MTLLLFIESFREGVISLCHFECTVTGCNERLNGHSIMTMSASYIIERICLPHASLFQMASGIGLMKKYPFLIGEVTGVTGVPECMFVHKCVDVSVQKSLQGAAEDPLVLSGNSKAPL